MKMNRVLVGSALGATLALMLSGCMSVSMGVTIHEDQTATTNYVVGYDKETFQVVMAYDSEDQKPVDDVCKAIEESQASALDKTNAEISWSESETECIISVKALTPVSFDENGIVSSGAETAELNPTDGINIVKLDEEARVTFDVDSFTSSTTQAVEPVGASWSQVITKFEISVTFPGEISSSEFSSSISEDKRTVRWDKDSMLEASEAGAELSATGSIVGEANFLIFILFGVLALFLATVVVLIVTIRKRNKRNV